MRDSDVSKPSPAPESGGRDRGRSERGDARELALLALCHLESYVPSEWPRAIALFWANPPQAGSPAEGPPIAAWLATPAIRGFAERLVEAVIARHTAIDAEIEATSRTWRLVRMDRVDRNILRLVAGEMGAIADTPRGVILAEAVRLAARYGSERSVAFVNGLAEGLAQRLRPTA
ncbi:MAG: transcription antitermination protein NusB [Nannocystis sp.]|nr:transcription antitermination protein NusB [Nannocystis sp.]